MNNIKTIAQLLQIPFSPDASDAIMSRKIEEKLLKILPLITTADGHVLTTEDTIYTPEEMDFQKTTFIDHGNPVTEFDLSHQPYEHPTSDICVMHSHELSTPISKCYFHYENVINEAKRQYEENRIAWQDDDDEWIYKPCQI